MKNYGVIIVPNKPTDFFAGTISGLPYEIRVPDGNHEKYLPSEERQRNERMAREIKELIKLQEEWNSYNQVI